MNKNNDFIFSLINKSKTSVGYEPSLNYLEEAHVLSQTSSYLHLYVHWLMFKLALKHRDYKEVLGQVPRLLLAVPGSLLGMAPQGNLGSTKMGIFERKIK